MKSKALSILFGTAAVLLVCWVFLPASPDYSHDRIYDESADGAAQVAAALARAKAEHKRVLLDFGANWCVWCHMLHAFLSSDPPVKAVLAEHYLVVLVDVNKEHNSATVQKYGFPTDLGLPVVLVLNADGQPLVTQGNDGFVNADTGEYESARVLAFLKKWAGGK